MTRTAQQDRELTASGRPRFTRLQLYVARDENRTLIGGLLGAVVAALVVSQMDDYAEVERALCGLLAGSVVATVVIVILTHAVFRELDHDSLHALLRSSERRRTALDFLFRTDESGLSWALQGSIVSIGAILWLLANGDRNGIVISLTVLGVAAAWVMMVAAYAVNYAREDADNVGLDFPGAAAPAYSDYLYQALTVASSVATSDADVTTQGMRRLISGNAVIAFVFNTVILAMLITLLTSAFGQG